MMKSRGQRKRASEHKGVYRCGRKWKSQIQCNGVQHYLGVYSTEEEAVREYTKAAQRLGKVAVKEDTGSEGCMSVDVSNNDKNKCRGRGREGGGGGGEEGGERGRRSQGSTFVSVPRRELNIFLYKLELGRVTVQLREYQMLKENGLYSPSYSTGDEDVILQLSTRQEELIQSIRTERADIEIMNSEFYEV